MDGPTDLPSGAPVVVPVESSELVDAYAAITAALAPMPLGVGMSLVTNVLGDLLIEAARRQGSKLGPSGLARIGRDGLFVAISARVREVELSQVTGVMG